MVVVTRAGRKLAEIQLYYVCHATVLHCQDHLALTYNCNAVSQVVMNKLD